VRAKPELSRRILPNSLAPLARIRKRYTLRLREMLVGMRLAATRFMLIHTGKIAQTLTWPVTPGCP